jgi:N-acetylmuramoyl-L-alanine amidase
MSKKVFIGVGHGGTDPGAVGYLKEADVNLTMATACKDYLEANGVTVKMSRTKDENDPVSNEIKECNAFDPDLAIDVHNNAGGGDGFEVIHSINGGVGKTLAQNIEAEVKKIGQNSRGLKTRKNSSGKDYFGFIRSTKCPAVICEGVFVDNAQDVKIADTAAEQKAFGVAYAKGIIKTLDIKPGATVAAAPTTSESATSGEFKVKVSRSDLWIRKGPGTNYDKIKFINPGVYTIQEVKSGKGSSAGWGRLKSGVGWISLDYATRV